MFPLFKDCQEEKLAASLHTSAVPTDGERGEGILYLLQISHLCFTTWPKETDTSLRSF